MPPNAMAEIGHFLRNSSSRPLLLFFETSWYCLQYKGEKGNNVTRRREKESEVHRAKRLEERKKAPNPLPFLVKKKHG